MLGVKCIYGVLPFKNNAQILLSSCKKKNNNNTLKERMNRNKCHTSDRRLLGDHNTDS